MIGIVNHAVSMPSPFGWLDTAAPLPGAIQVSGWALNVRALAGRRRICVYALNTGAGSNRELGCRDAVPIPTACESIAAEIENLKNEILMLRGDLAEATGRRRTFIQNAITSLQAQIVQKQAQLDACIAQG